MFQRGDKTISAYAAKGLPFARAATDLLGQFYLIDAAGAFYAILDHRERRAEPIKGKINKLTLARQIRPVLEDAGVAVTDALLRRLIEAFTYHAPIAEVVQPGDQPSTEPSTEPSAWLSLGTPAPSRMIHNNHLEITH